MRLVAVAVVVGVAGVVLAGCSGVTITPGARVGRVHSAYLVTRAAEPSEHDLEVKKVLEDQRLTVTCGMDSKDAGSDLMISYTDRWNWDIEMFLRALEIRVYDGRTHELLAFSRYSDTRVPYTTALLPLFLVAPWGAASPAGRQSKLEPVARDLLVETFAKLGVYDHEYKGPAGDGSPGADRGATHQRGNRAMP